MFKCNDRARGQEVCLNAIDKVTRGCLIARRAFECKGEGATLAACTLVSLPLLYGASLHLTHTARPRHYL